MSLHMQHLCKHYSRAPALLYYDFISVGGTKNNSNSLTPNVKQGQKGYNVVNK